MTTVPRIAITEQDKTISEEKPQVTKSEVPAIDLQDLSAAGPNNIHWINSSYSGADIKVVAHLYGATDREKKINEIKETLQISEEIITGCQNYISGEDLFLSRQRDFITAAGVGVRQREFGRICFPPGGPGGDIQYQAFTFLVANLLPSTRARDPRSTEYSSVLVAERLIQQQRVLADSLNAQLKNTEEMARYSSSTVALATLQTISVQSHREKFAVRSLGRSYVSGYTRGPRTIAGSMIFTIFNEHALYKLIRAMDDAAIAGETHIDTFLSSLIPDQLPPLDLTIVFANEYGSLSKMGIYGAEFVNDGVTMSIEDLMTENVVNFVARDVDIMTSVGLRRLNKPGREIYDMEGSRVTDASSLYPASIDAYHSYLDRLGVRRRYRAR
ncbi:MAG: hypothetical protein ACXABY_03015 [Candidatus Thorarchaeota archaeon]|jgi:hypothetical protein